MDQTPTTLTELSRAILFLIPVASILGLFTLLAVVGVARERRREREALYRHETARKLVEAGQMTFEQFSTFERAEAERPLAARRRGASLAGAVLMTVGLGAYYVGAEMDPGFAPNGDSLALLGAIPFSIGAGLLIYGAAAALHAAIKSRSAGRKQPPA